MTMTLQQIEERKSNILQYCLTPRTAKEVTKEFNFTNSSVCSNSLSRMWVNKLINREYSKERKCYLYTTNISNKDIKTTSKEVIVAKKVNKRKVVAKYLVKRTKDMNTNFGKALYKFLYGIG